MSRVHKLTREWGQRPGSAGVRKLLVQERGGDIDLSAMSTTTALLIRECWRRMLAEVDTGSPGLQAPCVVHGDLGPSAVLIDGDGVGIIDWDEARVDLPVFDLAGLPADARRRIGIDNHTLRRAALAWEVATRWGPEPAYARRMLAELQGRDGGR